jgi:hypothetical protein
MLKSPERAGGVLQRLPNNWKALSSNPSTAKKLKKEKTGGSRGIMGEKSLPFCLAGIPDQRFIYMNDQAKWLHAFWTRQPYNHLQMWSVPYPT